MQLRLDTALQTPNLDAEHQSPRLELCVLLPVLRRGFRIAIASASAKCFLTCLDR